MLARLLTITALIAFASCAAPQKCANFSNFAALSGCSGTFTTDLISLTQCLADSAGVYWYARYDDTKKALTKISTASVACMNAGPKTEYKLGACKNDMIFQGVIDCPQDFPTQPPSTRADQWCVTADVYNEDGCQTLSKSVDIPCEVITKESTDFFGVPTKLLCNSFYGSLREFKYGAWDPTGASPETSASWAGSLECLGRYRYRRFHQCPFPVTRVTDPPPILDLCTKISSFDGIGCGADTLKDTSYTPCNVCTRFRGSPAKVTCNQTGNSVNLVLYYDSACKIKRFYDKLEQNTCKGGMLLNDFVQCGGGAL